MDWNCTPDLQSAAALARLEAELAVVDVWRVKHPHARQYTQTVGEGGGYWHFHVKLLRDIVFCRRFEVFWGVWRGRKGGFRKS